MIEALSTSPVLVLFLILALGLALGKISVGGISLGSSGVLFVAMLAGHFHLTVPAGVTEIGTVIFVYCVGLGVGNRFFPSLRSKGKVLALLALIVVGTAWGATYLCCLLFGIDSAVGAGLFAGACTSTPGLAAAMEALQSSGGSTAAMNIGYGVAYPFGVIGVVLFVQLLPRVLKLDLNEDNTSADTAKDLQHISTQLVVIDHPNLAGKPIDGLMMDGGIRSRITRVLRHNMLTPVRPEDTLELGMEVLMVGTREDLQRDVLFLGHAGEKELKSHRFIGENANVIMLNPKWSNKTLRTLNLLGSYGIMVSRITRLGITFVPTGDTELIRNDVLHAVGTPEDLENFKQQCQHRSSAIGVTDLMSLAAGIVLGILVGKITIGGGADSAGFALGMAGGPLIVAVILGHFGRIGPIVGYMPRQARVLLMDFALMIFLAGAGVNGGAGLEQTIRAYGFTLPIAGVFITMVPLVVGYLCARKLMKMNVCETLGGICGSMTSTPALGAITAKTDKQAPVIAYTTAYPVALILMSLLAKCLVSLF